MDPMSAPPTGVSDFSTTTEPPPPLVTPEQAEEVASKKLFEHWGDCSAKTGSNIQDTFQRAAIMGSTRKNEKTTFHVGNIDVHNEKPIFFLIKLLFFIKKPDGWKKNVCLGWGLKLVFLH